MFRYPKNLFENFNCIKYCDLVKNKVHTDDALAEFESCLNDAQPITESDGQMELFCKNLYRGKPEMFVNLIKNRNSECLVLWTESKQIVRFFQLYGFIYIQYNKETRRYKVLKHRRLDDPNYQPQQQQAYDDDNRRDNRQYRRQDNRNPYNSNRNDVEEYPTLPGVVSTDASASASASSPWAKATSSGGSNSFRNKLVSSLLDEVTAPASARQPEPETSSDPEAILIEKD
jgi:hypothetical protein